MTTVLTTDLQLDSALCEQALQLGGHATLTEVLQKALECVLKDPFQAKRRNIMLIMAT